MNGANFNMRVVSIRSRGGKGGAIFYAAHVDNGRPGITVVCDFKVLPNPGLLDKGQLWEISGEIEERPINKGRLIVWEPHLIARSANLCRPSGENIVSWIADSNECSGVGYVKAQKIWDAYGVDLIRHIENSDIDKLMWLEEGGSKTQLLTEHSARAICAAFEKFGAAESLLWLDQMGVPRTIGQKVVNFYKDQTKTKIDENPYRLISFEARWDVVDKIAQDKFGFFEKLSADVRLEAAVEECLYSGLKSGHTCIPRGELSKKLEKLLGSKGIAAKALAMPQNSQYVILKDFYQASGMHFIEKYLADRLISIAKGESAGQGEMFVAESFDEGRVISHIEDYQNISKFTLNAGQRAAVLNSVKNSFSLILGGAGTGKTTVLKALYHVLARMSSHGSKVSSSIIDSGLVIYQIALAGRAAQRMKEASGHDAMTITAFLNRLDQSQEGEISSPKNTVIVLDEASMVDSILMYRLLRRIPAGVRLILVGDASQLPPIGPGLVLHGLVGNKRIPQVELTEVRRQNESSGIPVVAKAIRDHVSPSWATYNGLGSGVSFIECSDDKIAETIGKIYGELGADGKSYKVQCLASTKSRRGGVSDINSYLHGMYSDPNQPIKYFSSQHGVLNAQTEGGDVQRLPLRVGDLVMYTSNNYQNGLRNGSLGIITKALDVLDESSSFCLADFDGQEYCLMQSELGDLAHAYAITIHKSQGSQFDRVIVSVTQNTLLDQTLLYTAVTRGVQQVVFVGNLEAAEKAICSQAAVSRRYTLLENLLLLDSSVL